MTTDNLTPAIAELIRKERETAIAEGRAVEVTPGDIWAFQTKERAEAFAKARGLSVYQAACT